MFWRKPKEKERFYLLAGMGGRSLRRKNRIFLAWAILFGLIISGILACAYYFINKR